MELLMRITENSPEIHFRSDCRPFLCYLALAREREREKIGKVLRMYGNKEEHEEEGNDEPSEFRGRILLNEAIYQNTEVKISAGPA